LLIIFALQIQRILEDEWDTISLCRNRAAKPLPLPEEQTSSPKQTILESVFMGAFQDLKALQVNYLSRKNKIITNSITQRETSEIVLC